MFALRCQICTLSHISTTALQLCYNQSCCEEKKINWEREAQLVQSDTGDNRERWSNKPRYIVSIIHLLFLLHSKNTRNAAFQVGKWIEQDELVLLFAFPLE